MDSENEHAASHLWRTEITAYDFFPRDIVVFHSLQFTLKAPHRTADFSLLSSVKLRKPVSSRTIGSEARDIFKQEGSGANVAWNCSLPRPLNHAFNFKE